MVPSQITCDKEQVLYNTLQQGKDTKATGNKITKMDLAHSTMRTGTNTRAIG